MFLRALWCQIELTGWVSGGWVIISNASFVKQYLRKYSRSEVETLHVGRVWWEVNTLPIVDFDCFKEMK